MINKIYNCLHEFVLAVDLEYRHNLSDYAICNKASDLTQAVNEYINNPEVLYKELFETWCKIDIDHFINLIDIILGKPEDWQELSVKKYPSFGVVFNDLCKLYDEIVTRLDLNKNNDVVLPSELDTDSARKYFTRAIELGLMSNDYKWLKGLQLLSCFAREMSLNLNLGKGENADGSPRISWKPFEQLFAISTGKLRANYNDIQKTGQQPSESHLIDDIFS